ncbi:MAG: hypothetical protein RML94_16275, partial [Bacteroidia bacterium]|nr:hypothetical protein [Bacteroidia bacterium]
MGVSLWAFRFAHAHKVGVLRATLTLRCYASLRTVLTHALRMPHASCILMFYLVCRYTVALPY